MTTPAPETIEREQGKRLTLKQAAELFFGNARHASTLRAEIDRGNLVASKMGRAYWTTLPALQDMEAKCRVEAQVQGSGGIASAKPGPSSMAEPVIAQGAALRKLDELSKHFGTTSRGSTSRPQVRTRSSRMSSRPTQKSTSDTPSAASTSSTT
jgi:hypothetical protein